MLYIDIETYSSTDLKESGVYRYAEAPDFSILLFAYAWDDSPVQIVDLASGEELPQNVYEALTDPQIPKSAFNANFERVCINSHFHIKSPIESWHCTMVLSLMAGLPRHLKEVAEVLQTPLKSAGIHLIKYFSTPCKPTKSNGDRTRNLPEHAPDKWQEFKDYNLQDVVVERAIRKRVDSFYTIPDVERKQWILDQKINDVGLLSDPLLVDKAVEAAAWNKKNLEAEAVALSGITNFNSVAQIKKWLSTSLGHPVTKLAEEDVEELLKQNPDKTIKRILEIRQELGRSSIKKYQKIQEVVCSDGRVRGNLQYYGASRTGRWGGRHVQHQNLRRNDLPDLDTARELVKAGHFEEVKMFYGSITDTISQLVRTAFVAPKNKMFIVSDFASIEAVVVAWLAGEQWVLDAFRRKEDLYIATAAEMFGVAKESIDKKSPLRQKGKVAVLACGYQGGAPALIKMGALKAGLREEELPGLVKTWRRANPRIVKLWEELEEAAFTAIETRGSVCVGKFIRMEFHKGALCIHLPMGRKLAYQRARIGKGGRFSREVIQFESIGQKSKKWEMQDTYGGKLCENITQAVARDCLADAMLRLDAAGYRIVLSVHDEVVIEGTKEEVERVSSIMGGNLPWAPGLPLRAEASAMSYYMKD